MRGNEPRLRLGSRRPQRELPAGWRRRIHLGSFETLPQVLVLRAKRSRFPIQRSRAATPSPLPQPDRYSADDDPKDRHAERQDPQLERRREWRIGDAHRVETDRDVVAVRDSEAHDHGGDQEQDNPADEFTEHRISRGKMRVVGRTRDHD